MSQESKLEEWLARRRGNGSKVVAITGGKGGVGKSCLAAGLAINATRMGRRTVLIDGDLGLANLDIVLGLEANHDLDDVLAGVVTLEEALVEVMPGLDVLVGASGIPRVVDLPIGDQERLVREMERLEERADLWIIDTGAGIGRNVVEFCAIASEIVVVTTPEPTALTDAYALIKVVTQRVPNARFSVVVNLADDADDAFAALERISSVARRYLGIEVHRGGFLLRDPAVAKSIRARRHPSIARPEAPASKSLVRLTKSLGLDQEADDLAHFGHDQRFGSVEPGWDGRT